LAPSIERDLQDLLFDPQTSGGLLISVAGAASGELKAGLAAAGVSVWEIGRVVSKEEAGALISVI
jgi:selenide,water dikinase